jgi:hypothetical protein
MFCTDSLLPYCGAEVCEPLWTSEGDAGGSIAAPVMPVIQPCLVCPGERSD